MKSLKDTLRNLLGKSPNKDLQRKMDLKKRDDRIRKARAMKDNHSAEGWR